MRGPRPADLTLYLVTDTHLAGARGVPDVVRAAVAGGVSAVQVRDKDASRRELLALVRAVQDAVAGTGVPVLVDDAVDVALLAGADGVHLGQDDLPVQEVRALLGPDKLLGLSVSTPGQARAACALPPGTVDHLGAGPVWSTATKPDAAAPLGLDGLREVVAASALPVVAIGGIGAADAEAVRATGVAGICVVSAVCAAPDPAAAARALLPTSPAGPSAPGGTP
ncbi:thiamine phosphate synthase [Kineococcus glutinatus]|uniref:Thiamine-phosphate synthase n=1 Tax=Kineococcus glutinatus TaxID=1070872 RepID=A0ABP9H8D9_9ACTN